MAWTFSWNEKKKKKKPEFETVANQLMFSHILCLLSITSMGGWLVDESLHILSVRSQSQCILGFQDHTIGFNVKLEWLLQTQTCHVCSFAFVLMKLLVYAFSFPTCFISTYMFKSTYMFLLWHFCMFTTHPLGLPSI